jgi:hypothetical protein
MRSTWIFHSSRANAPPSSNSLSPTRRSSSRSFMQMQCCRPLRLSWGWKDQVMRCCCKWCEYARILRHLHYRVHNLQQVIANPAANYSLSLYFLCNAHIGANLLKKGSNLIGHDGWSKFPLSYDKIKHAALDARLGFEIARRCCQLVRYKSPMDRLNVIPLD